jgi:hypothetical protein
VRMFRPLSSSPLQQLIGWINGTPPEYIDAKRPALPTGRCVIPVSAYVFRLNRTCVHARTYTQGCRHTLHAYIPRIPSLITTILANICVCVCDICMVIRPYYHNSGFLSVLAPSVFSLFSLFPFSCSFFSLNLARDLSVADNKSSYIYIYIYIYILCIYVYMYNMHIYIICYVCMDVCMYAAWYPHGCIDLCTHTCVHTFMSTHTCIHSSCPHARMHTLIHIYTYIVTYREVTRVVSVGVAVIKIHVVMRNMGKFGYSAPVHSNATPHKF